MNKYDEALEELPTPKDIDNHVGHECAEFLSIYANTLQESLTKAKLFDEMVEARKRATRGEWSYTDHNWHESSIYASGTYLCTFDFDRAFAVTEDNQSEHEEKQGNNLKFVTLCANLTEKYVKESE